MNKLLLFVTFFCLLSQRAEAQCTITSTDGYTVHVGIFPRTVIVSTTDCPWGYNYNIGYDHVIYFTGPNIPPALYTLQTLIHCNGQVNGGYTLPLSGGNGYQVTSTNPYISNDGSAYNYDSPKPSCTSATVSNLPCNAIQVIIEGPGIPYQVIDCNATTSLPVEFISFKGAYTGAENLLTWNIESEVGCERYEIFRDNGPEWEKLASIPAKGVQNNALEYVLADRNPSQGINYYKLVQYDKDGAKTDLATISVYADIAGTGNLTVFPNPAASGNTNFNYTTSSAGEYAFRITDLSGRMVQEKKITESERTHDGGFTMTEAIELPATAQAYILEILVDDKPLARKRVVNN